MEGLTLWDILRSIGLMVFVYIALTKLSVYVREREIRTFKEGKATGRYNFFWRRAIRRMKRGDFAPPKSFKPVHIPHLSVNNLAMVAGALLEHADDEPMLDHEVELLNKVEQAFHKPGEPPEADIKLAIVVMQKYSHLLDDLSQVMLMQLQKTDWVKELKMDASVRAKEE